MAMGALVCGYTQRECSWLRCTFELLIDSSRLSSPMCVCLKQPAEELNRTESLSLREPSFSLSIFDLGHQSSAAFGLRLDLKPLSLLDLWLGNCTSLDLSAFMINVSQFVQHIYL